MNATSIVGPKILLAGSWINGLTLVILLACSLTGLSHHLSLSLSHDFFSHLARESSQLTLRREESEGAEVETTTISMLAHLFILLISVKPKFQMTSSRGSCGYKWRERGGKIARTGATLLSCLAGLIVPSRNRQGQCWARDRDGEGTSHRLLSFVN